MSWKVSINTIVDRGYNLDIKNPNALVEEDEETSNEILSRIDTEQNKIHEIVSKLKKLLSTE